MKVDLFVNLSNGDSAQVTFVGDGVQSPGLGGQQEDGGNQGEANKPSSALTDYLFPVEQKKLHVPAHRQIHFQEEVRICWHTQF